ncbi:MAG: bifunctional diaminohydroxyphosphoribosylaminopyrimidine deaminase/5-amino-6-(5-phosphoribosylamino)uracil reductase RibD [Pyramidobacter sp.]|jgi:diaminohydroxyphosphoribosylaminopyrimidine deaminase/5-amino-6-(5-phosphoribosylamino)uracil reductase
MRQQWIDEYYMHQALELALRGTGKTAPNPMVGCVIVKDGEVVGRGWHDHVGGLHAEAAALLQAGEKARGAAAYVTLEPCSHQGRQPPCAPALVEAGIARCVAAVGDPNPQVSGRGFQVLRDGGVETVCGVLASEALWMNRGFVSLQLRRRPWLTLKAAISTDGSMALENGVSQWITGEEARSVGHLLRSENDAILTGSGTLLHDDPALTVRLTEGPSPRPVILCRRADFLQRPFKALRGDALVLACEAVPVPRGWEDRVKILPADASGRPDLKCALEALGALGITRVHAEAGSRLSSALIASGLCDEYQIFAAPSFMGEGLKITGGFHVPGMERAVPFRLLKERRVGKDLWIEGGNPCSLDWLKPLEGC